jgi:hypothetical protein
MTGQPWTTCKKVSCPLEHPYFTTLSDNMDNLQLTFYTLTIYMHTHTHTHTHTHMYSKHVFFWSKLSKSLKRFTELGYKRFLVVFWTTSRL